MFEALYALPVSVQPSHAVEISWALNQIRYDKLPTLDKCLAQLPPHRPIFDEMYMEGKIGSHPIKQIVVIKGSYPEYLMVFPDIPQGVKVHYENERIDRIYTNLGQRYADSLEFNKLVGTYVFRIAFTLSLMRCGNMLLVPDHPTRQVRRFRERRGPDVDYRILTIDPTFVRRYQQRSPEEQQETRKPRPLHWARGHYAEYGVHGKGLLFGKIAGVFWIPAHVRGNPEGGLLLTDHMLSAKRV